MKRVRVSDLQKNPLIPNLRSREFWQNHVYNTVGFDAFFFSSYIISVPMYLQVNINYLSHCCGNSKLYLFWCYISKNKVNSSMFSICNPHFGTIENVIVSVLFSFCFQGKSITSWAYFWQAKTSNLKMKDTEIIIQSSLVEGRKITLFRFTSW